MTPAQLEEQYKVYLKETGYECVDVWIRFVANHRLLSMR
jgi:hypothetical protein